MCRVYIYYIYIYIKLSSQVYIDIYIYHISFLVMELPAMRMPSQCLGGCMLLLKLSSRFSLSSQFGTVGGKSAGEDSEHPQRNHLDVSENVD